MIIMRALSILWVEAFRFHHLHFQLTTLPCICTLCKYILPCCFACVVCVFYCFRYIHLHGQTLHNITKKAKLQILLSKVYTPLCIRISTLSTVVLNIYEDAWQETHIEYISTLGMHIELSNFDQIILINITALISMKCMKIQ